MGNDDIFPWRWKIRAPDFNNLQILPHLLKGIDLLGNKKETESLHSKDFIISDPLSSIQIEVP